MASKTVQQILDDHKKRMSGNFPIRSTTSPNDNDMGYVEEGLRSLGRGAVNLATAPAELVDLAFRGGRALGETASAAVVAPFSDRTFSEVKKDIEADRGTSILSPEIATVDKIIKKADDLKESKYLKSSDAANKSWREGIKDPNWWLALGPESALTFIAPLSMARREITKNGGKFLEVLADTFASAAAKRAAGKELAKLGSRGAFTGSAIIEGAAAHRDYRYWEEQNPEEANAWKDVFASVGTGVVAGGLDGIAGMGHLFFTPLVKRFGLEGAQEVSKELLTNLVKEIPKGVAIESVTEGMQELVANTFAKIGYDSDRELTEGIAEAMILGGALGGAFSAKTAYSKSESSEKDPLVKTQNKLAKAQQDKTKYEAELAKYGENSVVGRNAQKRIIAAEKEIEKQIAARDEILGPRLKEAHEKLEKTKNEMRGVENTKIGGITPEQAFGENYKEDEIPVPSKFSVMSKQQQVSAIDNGTMTRGDWEKIDKTGYTPDEIANINSHFEDVANKEEIDKIINEEATPQPEQPTETAQPIVTLKDITEESTDNDIVSALNNRFNELYPDVDTTLELSEQRDENVDQIASVLGKRVVIVRNTEESRKGPANFNGVVDPENDSVIFINEELEPDKRPMFVLGHEFKHTLKKSDPEAHTQLTELAKKYVDPLQFEMYKNKMKKGRQDGDAAITDDLVIEEMLADFTGDQFKDEKFWANINNDNPNLFKKVTGAIIKTLDKALSKWKTVPSSPDKFFTNATELRDTLKAIVDRQTGKAGATRGKGTTTEAGSVGQGAQGKKSKDGTVTTFSKRTVIPDDSGKPLKIYVGHKGDTRTPFKIEKGMQLTATTNAAAALSHSGSNSSVYPLNIKAKKIIEFPVTKTAAGTNTFDPVKFKQAVSKLKQGEVLVARNVYYPGSDASTKVDPEREFDAPGDVYGWNDQSIASEAKTEAEINKAKEEKEAKTEASKKEDGKSKTVKAKDIVPNKEKTPEPAKPAKKTVVKKGNIESIKKSTDNVLTLVDTVLPIAISNLEKAGKSGDIDALMAEMDKLIGDVSEFKPVDFTGDTVLSEILEQESVRNQVSKKKEKGQLEDNERIPPKKKDPGRDKKLAKFKKLMAERQKEQVEKNFEAILAAEGLSKIDDSQLGMVHEGTYDEYGIQFQEEGSYKYRDEENISELSFSRKYDEVNKAISQIGLQNLFAGAVFERDGKTLVGVSPNNEEFKSWFGKGYFKVKGKPVLMYSPDFDKPKTGKSGFVGIREVESAFPGANVYVTEVEEELFPGFEYGVEAPTENKTVYVVEFDSGIDIAIQIENKYIKINNQEEVRELWGEDLPDGDLVALGSFQEIDNTGFIRLVTDPDMKRTLDHEIFHAAEMMALSQREIKELEKKYGNVEQRAEAYINWLANSNKPKSLFQKIYDFAERLLNLFGVKTSTSIFDSVKTGKIWNRKKDHAISGLGMVFTPDKKQSMGQDKFYIRPESVYVMTLEQAQRITDFNRAKMVASVLKSIGYDGVYVKGANYAIAFDSGDIITAESPQKLQYSRKDNRSDYFSSPMYDKLKSFESNLYKKAHPSAWKTLLTQLANKGKINKEELHFSYVLDMLDNFNGMVSREEFMGLVKNWRVNIKYVNHYNSKDSLLDRLDIDAFTHFFDESRSKESFIEFIDIYGTPNKSKETWEELVSIFGSEESFSKLTQEQRATKIYKYAKDNPSSYLSAIRKEIMDRLEDAGAGGGYGDIQTGKWIRMRLDVETDPVAYEDGLIIFDPIDPNVPTYTGEAFIHWDTNNVLAHFRAELAGVDGVEWSDHQSFFINELQSDWHRDLSIQGPLRTEKLGNAILERYKGSYLLGKDIQLTNNEVIDLVNTYNGITGSSTTVADQIKEAVPGVYGKIEKAVGHKYVNAVSSGMSAISSNITNGGELMYDETTEVGIPEAPFEKTWPLLVFKNALISAYEKGAKSITWPSQFDQIAFIEGWTDDADAEASVEEDYEPIFSSEYKKKKEPITNIYFKTLPRLVDNFVKQFGSKVEKKKLYMSYDGTEEVFYVEITDQLMELARNKKVPMFSRKLDSRDPHPEVQARIEAAGKINQRGWFNKVGDKVKTFYKIFSSPFPELRPGKYGDLKNWLRLLKDSDKYGSYKAWKHVYSVVGNMNDDERQVFTMNLVLADIVKDTKPDKEGYALLEDGGLPFGYETVAEVQESLKHFRNEAMKSPIVMQALAKRRKMLKQLQESLVKHKFLPKSVLEDQNYFHHQVLSKMALEENYVFGIQHGLKTKRRGWAKRRSGSMADYNTDYVTSEFEVVSQAVSSVNMKELKAKIKKAYDVGPELRKQAKDENKQLDEIIPEGHVKWRPDPNSNWRKTFTFPDKIMQQIFQGKGLTEEELDKIQYSMVRGVDEQWIVPKEVANTLDEVGLPETTHELTRISVGFTSAWKIWTLINPFRVIRYNVNNMSGDLDIAMAYDYKILRYFGQSFRDLLADTSTYGAKLPFNLNKYGSKLTEDLKKELDLAHRMGVINSGFIHHEITDIKTEFDAMVASTGKGIAAKTYLKVWQGSKDMTNLRENILRLAAFRYFRERVNRGDKNIYAASNPAEIDAVKNPDERAAKLARELIGDYGRLTKGGEWMRRHMIPFYSWLEINAPRYVRMMGNLKHEGKSAAGLGASMTWKGGMLVAKFMAFTAMVSMWNALFFRDEEDELSDDQKRKFHIILGRRADGTIRYLPIGGAFRDALNWFSVDDAYYDLKDINEGRETFGGKFKESALVAPAEKLVFGSRPIFRTGIEASLGVTMYPDITNPTPIRDKFSYVARSFSMDIIEKHARGLPTQGVADDFTSRLYYNVDPGESAYYHIRNRVNNFLDSNNRRVHRSSPTEKSNALYYYKRSLRFGDLESAERYLKKYMDLGGSTGGMEISFKMGQPTAGIPNHLKTQFYRSLTPDDKAMLNRASKWYRHTYSRLH